MSGRVPMTKEGHEKLHEELKRLKTEERPMVIQAIAEARAHGDLSENAEYDAAKEKQGFIEGRIKEVEDKLARAQIIDPASIPRDRVAFGLTIHLEDVDTGEEIKYQLVGEEETDVDNGRISITSPIARALIGKQLDDTAIVITPGGRRELTVLDII